MLLGLIQTVFIYQRQWRDRAVNGIPETGGAAPPVFGEFT